MKLLAIDTATEACSAAINIDGEIILKHEVAPRRHAELILTMVDELLSESQLSMNQLDAFAFGRGPGAFTGVRIATGIIQGLAFSADRPVVPVSTLAALAQGVSSNSNRAACAIDARMGEVYWGLYETNEDGIMTLVGDEMVCPPDSVSLPETDNWLGVGSGWKTYEAELTSRLGTCLNACQHDDFPSAEGIAVLAADGYRRGLAIDAADAQPIYLRDKVTG